MSQEYLDTDHSEDMKVDINREIFKFLLQAKTKTTTISCQLKEDQAGVFPFQIGFGVTGELEALRSICKSRVGEEFTVYDVYRSLVRLDLRPGSRKTTLFFQAISKLQDRLT